MSCKPLLVSTCWDCRGDGWPARRVTESSSAIDCRRVHKGWLRWSPSQRNLNQVQARELASRQVQRHGATRKIMYGIGNVEHLLTFMNIEEALYNIKHTVNLLQDDSLVFIALVKELMPSIRGQHWPSLATIGLVSSVQTAGGATWRKMFQLQMVLRSSGFLRKSSNLLRNLETWKEALWWLDSAIGWPRTICILLLSQGSFGPFQSNDRTTMVMERCEA